LDFAHCFIFGRKHLIPGTGSVSPQVLRARRNLLSWSPTGNAYKFFVGKLDRKKL
jgi:hypothetical protein